MLSAHNDLKKLQGQWSWTLLCSGRLQNKDASHKIRFKSFRLETRKTSPLGWHYSTAAGYSKRRWNVHPGRFSTWKIRHITVLAFMWSSPWKITIGGSSSGKAVEKHFNTDLTVLSSLPRCWANASNECCLMVWIVLYVFLQRKQAHNAGFIIPITIQFPVFCPLIQALFFLPRMKESVFL